MPKRYASAPSSEKELRQALLNFDDRIRDGVLLRIVVTTDAKGIPLSVSLIEYEQSSKETLNTFVIPETAAAAVAVAEFPKPEPKPGVLLPKPSVRIRAARVKPNAEPSK